MELFDERKPSSRINACHSGLKLYEIDAFISYKKPLSPERGSEWSERESERVSAAEGASEASSPEQANE